MKISIRSIVPFKEQSTNFKKSASFTTAPQPHFDAITIQSNQRQIADQTFANKLATSISSDMKTVTTEEEKLVQLKHQIKEGTYHLDSVAIASKILLLK